MVTYSLVTMLLQTQIGAAPVLHAKTSVLLSSLRHYNKQSGRCAGARKQIRYCAGAHLSVSLDSRSRSLGSLSLAPDKQRELLTTSRY